MKKIILILTVLVFSFVSEAQVHRLFTSDHQLSSSLINNVFQDSYGMIWVSTENGLNRYDGSKFTVYRNIPGDSTSLAHNFTNKVFEDRDGNLFVGSYGGIQLYDRISDTFSPPATFDDKDKASGMIGDFFQRKNGDIWALGNDSGIVRIISKNKVKIIPIDIKWNILDFAHFGLEDTYGNIWIIKDEDGLYRIDNDGKIHHYFNNAGSPILTAITDNSKSELYFGTMSSGLIRYNYKTNSFDYVGLQGHTNRIRDLFAEENGDILIASDGGGLYRYSVNDGKTYPINNGVWHLDPNLLKVHSVIKDNDGNIWLGLYQKGVEIISNHLNNFNYIGHKSAVFDLIGSNCVSAIMKEDNGNLWVGTDNDGMYLVNPEMTASRHYKGNGIPNVVLSFFKDNNGRIWLGSFTGGAGYIDPASGRYTDISLTDPNGKKVQRVYAYTQDKYGDIWIATMGFGLFRYTPSTGQAISVNGINSNIDSFIGSIYYSRRTDTIYLGTYYGVQIMSPMNPAKVSRIEPKSIIFSIREDNAGKLWFATSEGLKVYDRKSREITIFTKEDGLPVNTVYSIEISGDNVWISTSNGLSKFSQKDRSFTNYYVDNGLQGNEFYKNTSFADHEGNLFFGGLNGITYFNPDSLAIPGRKLNPRISDFLINGTPVRDISPYAGRPYADDIVYEASEFHLSYDDNPVTIEFSTRELAQSESVRYLYSLDNGNWVSLPQGVNSISLSNLGSGKHPLLIKAIDNGVESEVKMITIIVSPPWYRSVWAWIAYVIILLAIVYAVYLFIRQRNRRKKEILEQNYTRQLYESRTQYFINVSHEIRSPMSLVIAPIQKLIANEKDADKKQSYNLIYRNAKRVLRLVNELMDIRKIDKGLMKLIYHNVDIVKFIEDIHYTYSEAMDSKHIRFEFNHDEYRELFVWLDRSNFDKVMVNLLSNALKFTPEGGTIHVDLNVENPTEDNSGFAVISVTDSGSGIPDNEKERVFERFYQVMDNNAGGSGVGLHLTRALVKLHGGTISVTDNPDGKGARFIVRIPLGKPKADEHHIIADNDSDESHDIETSLLPDIASEEISNVKTLRKGLIFIVEDDEQIRSYIRSELSAHYKVMEFNNGKDAYNEIFRTVPDLIVCDVMMPEMDGLTFTRKVKQNMNLNHIPVILLTAKAEDEDTLSGLKTGADAYMAKPFNMQILRTIIDNLIITRRNLQNIYTGRQTQENRLEEIETVSANDKLMERIMKVVNSNLDNAEFTIENFASEIGMSRMHLNRKLKEITNQAPRDFLRNIRLQQAARLLSENKVSVSEVAYMVGFKNPNHFSAAFKELYGISPSAYMENAKNKQ